MTSQDKVPPKPASKLSTAFGLKYRIIIPFGVVMAVFIFVFISTPRSGQTFAFELLFIVVLAILAVVGLDLLFTWLIDQRVNTIIDATEQVANGDLSVRVVDNRHDEIGRLARAFNEMITNIDHLQDSRDLLSRTMSPAVRQSLLERGLDFRGIIQDVTMLFIDIRDFTQITESYQNTEKLVIFLNDYYTTIANQVHSGGGIINKYAGDSILACFGAPTSKPPSKSSTEALLAALALQDAIEDLSQRWQILGLPPIRVGIGISLGPVVAGPIGSREQFDYTVIGDAVNLASRLQDLTRNVQGYGLIMSAEVYEALEEKIKEQVQVVAFSDYKAMTSKERSRSLLQFVDFGEVLVKGKKGPVRVYGIPD